MKTLHFLINDKVTLVHSNPGYTGIVGAICYIGLVSFIIPDIACVIEKWSKLCNISVEKITNGIFYLIYFDHPKPVTIRNKENEESEVKKSNCMWVTEYDLISAQHFWDSLDVALSSDKILEKEKNNEGDIFKA